MKGAPKPQESAPMIAKDSPRLSESFDWPEDIFKVGVRNQKSVLHEVNVVCNEGQPADFEFIFNLEADQSADHGAFNFGHVGVKYRLPHETRHVFVNLSPFDKNCRDQKFCNRCELLFENPNKLVFRS